MLRLLFLLSALAAGLLPLAYAGDEGLRLSMAQVKSLGVVVQAVDAATPLGVSGLPARVVVPNAQMQVVSAPVGAIVTELLVAPGDSVRKGQVLARLGSREALELQREASQAGSQFQLAEQARQRDELLFKEGLIPEARLQATRAAHAQARALAGERQQGLLVAGGVRQRGAGSLELLAQQDGVVLEQGVQLGQHVEPGSVVYRLARLKPLWLELQVPLALASTLRPGLAVQAGGVTGRILAVGRAVDPQSQSVLLRAVVQAGAEQLIPGQVVEAEIESAALSGVTLPAQAVVRHAGQTLVFVLQAETPEQMQFMAQPVRELLRAGTSVRVEGLPPGARIAIRGVSGLKAVWTGVGRE